MSVQPVRKIFFLTLTLTSYSLLVSFPYCHNTTSTSIHRPPLVASMAAFCTNGRTQCGLACSLGLSRYRYFAYRTLRLLNLLSLVLSPCSASCAYYHNPPNTPTPPSSSTSAYISLPTTTRAANRLSSIGLKIL